MAMYMNRKLSPINTIKNYNDQYSKFREIMTIFMINCLTDSPSSIIDYAADYFTYLLKGSKDNLVDEDAPVLQRHKAIYAEPYNPEDDVSIFITPQDKKTSMECEVLSKVIDNCLLFKNLNENDIKKLIDVMVCQLTEPNEVIIKEGDDGDNFYVIERGIFHAYERDGNEEKLIHTYENSGGFGELALMYNQPRAATVISEGHGKLWALNREMFRHIVLRAAFKKRTYFEKLLNSVPLLTTLNNYERQFMADALVSMNFKDGDVIMHENDVPNGMYFIQSGQVKVEMNSTQINVLGPGEYFGELALLLKQTRVATITAVGDVTVAFLDVNVFESVLGPCIDILSRNIDLYEKHLVEIFGKNHSNSIVIRNLRM